jgi:hypothetical protein
LFVPLVAEPPLPDVPLVPWLVPLVPWVAPVVPWVAPSVSFFESAFPVLVDPPWPERGEP